MPSQPGLSPRKYKPVLKAEINPVLFNFPLEALAAFALVIKDVKGTEVRYWHSAAIL